MIATIFFRIFSSFSYLLTDLSGSVVFLFILLMLLLSVVYWTWRNGISPMPSSKKARTAMLALVPAEFQGTIYELGSGWGNLARNFAIHCPHARVNAFETSPIPYYWSKIVQAINPQKNLNLHKQNFFHVSLENAELVICYLYPKAMQALRPKFEAELKTGTWVISNTFSIPHWQAEKTLRLPDLYHTPIYFYKYNGVKNG